MDFVMKEKGYIKIILQKVFQNFILKDMTFKVKDRLTKIKIIMMNEIMRKEFMTEEKLKFK